jgi:DNA-binding HxlR family transcriptional regulator
MEVITMTDMGKVMNAIQGEGFITRKTIKELGVSTDTIKAMIEDGILRERKPYRNFDSYKYSLTEKGLNIKAICGMLQTF